MRKLLSTLPVLFLLLALASCKKETAVAVAAGQKEVTKSIVSGDVWTKLGVPSVPITSNIHNLSFGVNDKVWVALPGPNQLYEYDPLTAGWSLKNAAFFQSPMNVETDIKFLFSNGNTAYFLTFTDRAIRQYNVSTGIWTATGYFPGTATIGLAATATTTKGYVMSGGNEENWEYDFTANSWTQKLNSPGIGRTGAAAYAIGDKVYFGTGFTSLFHINPVTFKVSIIYTPQSDWYEYSTTTNSWTAKASFGGGVRYSTQGFAAGGKVYLGFGLPDQNSEELTDFWSYDPASNTWSQRRSFPSGPGSVATPLWSVTGAAGQGYGVGAWLVEFWQYTPPYSIFNPFLSAVPATLKQ